MIICDDVLHWAETTPPIGAHALICDPPYHLVSGNAVYDLAKTGAGHDRVRRKTAGGGFMGARWDGLDTDGRGIAFRAETWAALARHLLPGAFVMAFASSRGWHRLAVAMEDAGLIIHPSIFIYAYGSGFPKATRIPDERFDGHRYGLQCLKPSAEPLIVAQVPYAGRSVDSITRTGAGALWIEGGRLGTESIRSHGYPGEDLMSGIKGSGVVGEPDYHTTNGRWPPNLALCHTSQCRPLDTRQVQGTERVRRLAHALLAYSGCRGNTVPISRTTPPPMAPRPCRPGLVLRDALSWPSTGRRESGVVVHQEMIAA